VDKGGLRKDLWRIAQAALAAVTPEGCIRRAIRLDGERLSVEGRVYDLADVRRLLVAGFGKASARMAAALEEILGDRIAAGLVVTADGYKVPTARVEVVEAAHPVPDARGLAAARRIAELVSGAEEGDLVVVLISGGGSALLTLPAEEVSLSDLMRTNELLLRSGAKIQEMNAVRKHLSQVKGGQLARLASPAQVVSLILSDVPGDPLDSIASGPTAPDPTTFQDAARILKRYGLWDEVPQGVRARIEAGLQGEVPETPKPGDPVFELVQNVIVGSGRVAAEAAREEGASLGYQAQILTTTLEGEASEVGKVLAALARELVRFRRPIAPPALLVAAGETTVTVRGSGKGGRNQELALSAALGIEGLSGVAILSLGTDGRDGPTDAAGGMVDGGTTARIRTAGVDPEGALVENDSYHALKAASDLLVTGPTGTNVADLYLVLAGKEDG
jgi:hydroxypyruvate reductase